MLFREGHVGAWLSDHKCSGEGTLGRLANVSGREGGGCELQQERLELDIRKNCGIESPEEAPLMLVVKRTASVAAACIFYVPTRTWHRIQ